MPNALNDLAGEPVQKHSPCGGWVESPGSQIKDRVVIHLADRRPVGALHVVGINLELRLRVRRRIVAEQQVFVGLLGVGFLRAGLHEDAAVKDTARLVIKYAVEIFVAVAVRCGVLDNHVVIGQLLPAQHVQPIENTLNAWPGQAHA